MNGVFVVGGGWLAEEEEVGGGVGVGAGVGCSGGDGSEIGSGVSDTATFGGWRGRRCRCRCGDVRPLEK